MKVDMLELSVLTHAEHMTKNKTFNRNKKFTILLLQGNQPLQTHQHGWSCHGSDQPSAEHKHRMLSMFDQQSLEDHADKGL